MRQAAVISIVDDDQDVRLGLQSFLRSAGLEVFTFDSAEAFLGSPFLQTTKCLVTDIHMPGMGGLALQEELNRQGCEFAVIVMTAYATPEVEQRSTQLGATAFLTKPVDPDQLLERVEGCLQ